MTGTLSFRLSDLAADKPSCVSFFFQSYLNSLHFLMHTHPTDYDDSFLFIFNFDYELNRGIFQEASVRLCGRIVNI